MVGITFVVFYELLIKKNDTDARILLLLEQIHLNPEITISELAKMTKKAKSTILRDIEKLKKLDKIERIDSEKAGNWRIIK